VISTVQLTLAVLHIIMRQTRLRSVLAAFFTVLLAQFCQAESEGAVRTQLEKEYQDLWGTVEDKVGLEAIRSIHQQLDDDNDGTIEPSETGDFIKADLQPGLHDNIGDGLGAGNSNNFLHSQYVGDGRREKLFHKKDKEITVGDLWQTWTKSEVHNWTVEQTVEWLSTNVDLPQYKEVFIKEGITGNLLPKAAADPNFLSHRLGISSSLHRSKISLKAMDVVLFGPPKEPSNWLKDVILTSLLLALLTALFWAYRTKKHSEAHLSRMMKDMESLAKAERALQDMQNKLTKQEQVIKDVKVTEVGGEEVGRLREEVEILRGELQRAEVELEDRCWMAPTMLQHWLQLTYELESLVFNGRKRAAEQQMEVAKDACEKLKRKRSSLVGSFVSTHGRSIDDVDKSILEAKTSLLELTTDLSERSQRWRQIEILTGVSIVNNPGIQTLQRLVRHVGGGNKNLRGSDRLSSRMSSVSVDDLREDLETRSVAASHSSRLTSNYNSRRTALANISRESSKESSEDSDEVSPGHVKTQRAKLVKQQSRLSEMSVVSSNISDSQDSRVLSTKLETVPSQEQTLTVSVPSPVSGPTVTVSASGSVQSLHTSSSDSALSSLRVSANLASHHLEEVEESCSQSDTGSVNDLDGKKKKKRSFFNFRKKKEKAVS